MKVPARLAAAAVAAALVAAMHSAQSAAQGIAIVRGRVTIGIPVTTRRPTNTYARTGRGLRLARTSELRNVIVYLKDAPHTSVAPARAEIRQLNETFIPRAVAVTVGSEVSFPNADPFYHNVFSLSRPRTFDLGRYPSGQTRSVRVDRPGLIKVFCQIHSHMAASIMVFNHPWYAVPDESGHFELNDLPPGQRQFAAWHERLGETTVTLRLTPGSPSTVDFVLPVPQQ
jgi:plastocyanin